MIFFMLSDLFSSENNPLIDPVIFPPYWSLLNVIIRNRDISILGEGGTYIVKLTELTAPFSFKLFLLVRNYIYLRRDL